MDGYEYDGLKPAKNMQERRDRINSQADRQIKDIENFVDVMGDKSL